jgi:hypothetical protein
MVRRTDSETPLPASLLLRVAEAADGLRDGLPHWFVVSRKAPHSVTPFDSSARADRERDRLGRSKYVVLGPYQTPPHPAPRGARRKKRKIRSVLIYFEGEKKPVKVDPARVDAIFLSAAALDKFAYPYYSRVHGVAEAAKMRARHLAEADAPLVFHAPWTEG